MLVRREFAVPDSRAGVLPERAASLELELREFAQEATIGARRNVTCVDVRLAQQKIRVLRMLRDIFPCDRAHDIYFEIVLASILESAFCQFGGKTLTAQVLRNFRVTQHQ